MIFQINVKMGTRVMLTHSGHKNAKSSFISILERVVTAPFECFGKNFYKGEVVIIKCFTKSVEKNLPLGIRTVGELSL